MPNHLWGAVAVGSLKAAVANLRLRPESTLPEVRAELLHAKIVNPLGRFDVLTHVGKHMTARYIDELSKQGFTVIDVIAGDRDVKWNSRAHAYVGWYFDKDQKPQCCWLHLHRGELNEGTFSRALRENLKRKADSFPDNVNFHFTDLSGLTHAE